MFDYTFVYYFVFFRLSVIKISNQNDNRSYLLVVLALGSLFIIPSK